VTKPGNRFLKGHNRYWKGKTLPDYVKAKISEKLSGKNNPFMEENILKKPRGRFLKPIKEILPGIRV